MFHCFSNKRFFSSMIQIFYLLFRFNKQNVKETDEINYTVVFAWKLNKKIFDDTGAFVFNN